MRAQLGIDAHQAFRHQVSPSASVGEVGGEARQTEEQPNYRVQLSEGLGLDKNLGAHHIVAGLLSAHSRTFQTPNIVWMISLSLPTSDVHRATRKLPVFLSASCPTKGEQV